MRLFILLFAASAFSHSSLAFTDGHYVGSGIETHADGTVRHYDASIHIQKPKLHFHYEFESEKPVEWDLVLIPESHGFFKVGTLGEGYCSDSMCHYRVKLKEDVEEWTWIFSGATLTKLGSRVGPSVRKYWHETLSVRP